MSIVRTNKIQNSSGVESLDFTTSGIILATPSSVSGQSVIDSEYIYTLNADRTIIATVVGATFYSMFGVGLTVPPGTYGFSIFAGLSTGATSHTVSFNLGGTATIQDSQFSVDFLNAVTSTGITTPTAPTSTTRVFFNANPNSVANGVVSAASTTASKSLNVNGIFRISGTGRVDPQIGFSANPTGTNSLIRGSHIRIIPISTSINTNVSYGVWS
jgi:hypothetical protein